MKRKPGIIFCTKKNESTAHCSESPDSESETGRPGSAGGRALTSSLASWGDRTTNGLTRTQAHRRRDWQTSLVTVTRTVTVQVTQAQFDLDLGLKLETPACQRAGLLIARPGRAVTVH